MRRIIPATALVLIFAFLTCSTITLSGHTQEIAKPAPITASAAEFSSAASNLIIPQTRSYLLRPNAQPVGISEVAAEVRILQQVATTTLDVGLTNPSGNQQEAEMLIPVPDNAVVRSFTFAGSGSEPSAKLLPKAEAKRIYQSIVSKLKDPALLEFAGYNLVRSSVFPVAARGKQRVRLVYEHILPADGNRVDYVLPRSESFEATATPWKINVTVTAKSPLSAIYSPSHQVALERPAPGHAIVRVAGEQKLEPGPFRLSYLVEGNGLTASLLAYPDERVGGGYFLLLAGIPGGTRSGDDAVIKREVTLVIDRSGSMAGEKIEQARKAALQVVEGLNDGEAFNIIDYSDSIARFSERPMIKSTSTMGLIRAYIRRLNADGGTNIHDALVEAMLQPPTPNMLPLTIFLTDGLATSGETRERAIRSAVIANNKHNRRIFSFGVGFDVNAPLLTSVANATRATPTFVFPNESVELKVSQVFRRLSGPVLADPKLTSLGPDGAVTTRAVRELLPAELNDVFEGDQIVLLGQYQNDEPLHLRVNGNYLGTLRTFDLKFDLKNATKRNAFVPRLWASRKIARLIEIITEAGADSATVASISNRGSRRPTATNATALAAHSTSAIDPKLEELVDEIVRLSTEYGVLTEYTSFLATDGTDFTKPEEIRTQTTSNFVNNVQNIRSGMGGVTQMQNVSAQRTQSNANRSNFYLTQNMQRVEITNVQQITDRTFFKRSDRWVEASVLDRATDVKPDQTVEFGTAEFYELVDQLVREGRQGILALSGEMLLVVNGKTVLIKAPPKSK